MDFASRNLRHASLLRIASLSASPAAKVDRGNANLDRLASECPSQSENLTQSSGPVKGYSWTAQIPMSVRELQVLLALCRAAPLVENMESAEKLLSQLCPYLIESHCQRITPSPFLSSIQPSPWECLTSSLSEAILCLGLRFPRLHEDTRMAMDRYIDNVLSFSAVEFQDSELLNFASTVTSFLGFLETVATYIYFWTSNEQLSLIARVKQILSNTFPISVEATFSTIRNSHDRHLRAWKRYSRHYAAHGKPLGSMLLQRGFMKLLLSTTSTMLVTDPTTLQNNDILDILMSSDDVGKTGIKLNEEEEDRFTVQALAEIATEEVALIEDGADYLQLGTAWQQHLAFSVKAFALASYCNCVILSGSAGNRELLMKWLDTTIQDPIQMADETLAGVTLKVMAIVSQRDPALASSLSRTLPRFIVRNSPSQVIVKVAAQCLAFVLKFLSQDVIITTLYTLGNVLSSGVPERALQGGSLRDRLLPYDQQTTGSAISLALNSDEEKLHVYASVIEAIVGVAKTCKDEKIIALAQSILTQKTGKVNPTVDTQIVIRVASLALVANTTEFKSILKLYSKLGSDAIVNDDTNMLSAILAAREYISKNIEPDSPLLEVYLTDLLECIVAKGDVQENEPKRQSDLELAARDISQYLSPLVLLFTSHNLESIGSMSVEIQSICRDAWYNCVVHGFSRKTVLARKYDTELRIIAKISPPLIADTRTTLLESDMELNTVLRRGMNVPNTIEHKKRLIELLPEHAKDIGSLSYPKVIFLETAFLLESLRASCGNCSEVLSYFVDPLLKAGDTAGCMMTIANEVTRIYLDKARAGMHPEFSAAMVGKQLVKVFTKCCHRVEKVHAVAISCAERIIGAIPSALCQQSSLYAMLELLTLMWCSCLDEDIDEYSWRSTMTSVRGGVTIELSDSYPLRRRILKAFHTNSRKWVLHVLNMAPMDIKGLLQTYLSEYDDDNSFGHISLGRSFALTIGSEVPASDQRLASLDSLDGATAASDFMKQYTTRQGYRHADPAPEHEEEWLRFMQIGRPGQIVGEDEETIAVLENIQRRAAANKFVAIAEQRDVLRRAAALLCRSKKNSHAIVAYLVSIPFTIFTKQSIKLGISLWMGIINEKPGVQSRILAEVAQHWEETVRKKIGLFSDKILAPDAFSMKMEYAPSDKEVLMRQLRDALNLITPHQKILYMLSSHFHACRLGNPHIIKIFQRIVRVSMAGLKDATGHPLARETRLQLIIFGLQVLLFSSSSNTMSHTLQYKLKDQILSGALSWFSNAPSWTFGGNRLQLRSELQAMIEIMNLLMQMSPKPNEAESTYAKALRPRQDLVCMLLENEHARLMTWLYPLDNGRKNTNYAFRSPADNSIAILLQTAWLETPRLAIQLTKRFQSPRLTANVRNLLLRYPEQVVDTPEAIQLILGGGIPPDISFQLKYLLYWAPVDPITATTYFLPSYSNNAFILQYAMRSLESHSVDTTFFYVPQIVQALRWDELGYVECFILETAKFSQLFAHQIIWNMKANAYKDEEALVPDEVKPKLDVAMERLISSFSPMDKSFYEREFNFFGEVTSISGKLRPYIKKSKAEKKQKIDEELRKIKVDVGVYVPSNPDGVVIGIDRKSGRPLQSHAKAPFMATFRIKRTKKGDVDSQEENLRREQQNAPAAEPTNEMWLSAIFKVGDDVRQDMLVLQIISAFRSIYNSVGLDVYVFPYRVLATAPGCGVIDLIPKSISRDMLGREAINGLYDYFTTKYGGEDSIKFQEARNNFVKSMAAYSVISYLLQLKDRHNGNIMIDDAGHIIHIDFGFCFDIAPGGITFERAPFKLTSEMIAVMGGSQESQPYHWFEELCVKAFLACRPYADKLAACVKVMSASGLPCFKPDTIQNFKDRLVLDKNEKEAADFMRSLVKKSYSSYSTKGYDQFQLLTNGIPY
ncbi:hypothetical protein L211DRAFT_808851 [Terfezia boudieri ATCC MYA-4762]|uniref:1-phosphatidylinositol 4-kinase n=1 Tax=Terfezia boudieri ATCC MYA-4762 TaxID=1051890 RepID=A0A3N4LLM6_9PEZI|nr:hypothetical protein L211DRAFT_808851 [Terfezia boudieri ATCC MYA-4762]